jgi:hypothetical protein
MPLPAITKYGARQCKSKSKRTGLPCKNLAAHGCLSCRMHGAHKSKNVLKGEMHPNFKHGFDTKDAIKERKQKFAELSYLAKNLCAKVKN